MNEKTTKREVIDALLKSGMTPEQREEYDLDQETPTITKKLKEKKQ